jgi:HEPN domain-containing protein
MSVQRHPPESPREWLNRARSDLALAGSPGRDIYLEDLCFHAQQAAEKAVKALVLMYGVEFSYVHDIAQLMTLLEEAGQQVPDSIKEAERLTRFAVATRYPGLLPPISSGEHQETVVIAPEVVSWVEDILQDSEEQG